MIRALLRFFGLFALAGAFAVLAIDAAHTLVAGRAVLTDAASLASAIAPNALARAPRWLAATLQALGRLPAALALAVLGAALFRLARAPRPRIGYGGRA